MIDWDENDYPDAGNPNLEGSSSTKDLVMALLIIAMMVSGLIYFSVG